MRLLLTLLLLIWGTDAYSSSDVDPLYIAMIQEFEEDMVWKVDTDLEVVPIKVKNILGVCFTRSKIIYIKPLVSSLPYFVRKALVYHELAHCELGLGHSQIGDHSLTDPYIYADSPLYYELYWPQLVQDLRNKYLARFAGPT